MSDFLKPNFKRDPSTQSADRGVIDVRAADEIRRRVTAAANGANSGIAAVSVLGNIPSGGTITVPSGITLSVAGNEYTLDVSFVVEVGAVLEISDFRLQQPITGAGSVVATKINFTGTSVAAGNISDWTLIECDLPAVITTGSVTNSRISGARPDGYAAISCGQITESRISITGSLTSPGPIRSTVHLVGNWVAAPDLGVQSSIIAWNVTAGGGGGSGTVTSVSVVSANGLAGTVANPTTTPAITLSTTVAGVLKGDGYGAIVAAVPGTDFAPAGNYVTLDTVQTITATKTINVSSAADALRIVQAGAGDALEVVGALRQSGGVINMAGVGDSAIAVTGNTNFNISSVGNLNLDAVTQRVSLRANGSTAADAVDIEATNGGIETRSRHWRTTTINGSYLVDVVGNVNPDSLRLVNSAGGIKLEAEKSGIWEVDNGDLRLQTLTTGNVRLLAVDKLIGLAPVTQIEGTTELELYSQGPIISHTGPAYTERMRITPDGYVGIGDTTPDALLSVGPTSQFRVNDTGNLVRVNNVPYSWPATQGATDTVLTNDGYGTLSWTLPPDDIPYSVAPAIAVTGGSVITYDGYIVRPVNISGSGSFTVDTAGVPDGAIMTLVVETVSGTAMIETDGYVHLHAREWLPESAGEILTLQYVASLGYWAETSRSITYDSSAGFLAKNGSGVTIPRGTVVYISGATGNNPLILPADFSSEATSAGTVGMVYDDIPNNEFGHVITVGIVRNVNTLGMTAGGTVYLGAAGAFTTTKPSAPNHIVKVGNVVRTSATVGTIQVQISNGWELDELHDVDIDSPAKGNLLVRNNSNLWQNFAAGPDGYVLSAASTDPTGLTWSRIIGLTDGNKGSITVSGDGSTWLLNNNTVTNNELADMLNNRIKGRIGSIPGDPQDLTGTEVTTLLDTFTSSLKGLAPASGGGTTNFLRADGTWAAPPAGTVTSVSVVSANGLAGSVANATTTPAITLSTSVTGLLAGNGTAISAATIGSGLSFSGGTLSNTQIGLTDGDKGDITVASSGASWTVDANAISNTKLADMPTATFKGRVSAGTGDPEDLTGTQATTLLDTFTSSLKGLAPASGGGTSNFLRADGTWAAPAGTSGGTVTSVSVVSANGLAGTVANATTTPAITLSTSVTGLLKGNGTAISAAVSGVDYAPAGNYVTLDTVQTITETKSIDVSSTAAALRITQAGTGEALRVEDSTSPDSTPFVVTSAGYVGVGTAAPSKKVHIRDSGLLIDGASSVESAPFAARLIVDSGASTGHTLADLRNNNGSRLFVGGSTVGIGTATPLAALDLASGQFAIPDGTAAAPAIAFRDDLNTGIFSPTNDIFGISVNGSEAVRVLESGSTPVMLIGTSTVYGAITVDSASASGTAGAVMLGHANAGTVIQESYRGGQFAGVRSRGTKAAPTGVASGDGLVNMLGAGVTATGGVNYGALITMKAAETFTSTASGGRIEFHTTLSGTDGFTTLGGAGTARMIISPDDVTIQPPDDLILVPGDALIGIGSTITLTAGATATVSGTTSVSLNTSAQKVETTTTAVNIEAASAGADITITAADNITNTIGFKSQFKVVDITSGDLSTIDYQKILNTVPTRGPDGSAAAPAYSFSAATGTGMWRAGKGLNFAVDGYNILTLDQNSSGNQVQSVADGTATRPAYTWSSQTGTGFYYDATDTYIGISISGTFAALIGSSGMTGMQARGASINWAPGSATSLPAYGFFGDSNTGMYSPATDIIEFSTGGDVALRLDASAVTSGYTPSIITNDTGMAVGHNSSSRNLTLNTASTPRVTIAGNGDFVEIDSALVYEPGTAVSLTADNQVITVGSRSYIRFSANVASPTDRTFTISNGVRVGHVLILECTGGSAELLDTGNVQIAGTMTFTVADTLSLIWNGTDWIETSRAFS